MYQYTLGVIAMVSKYQKFAELRHDLLIGFAEEIQFGVRGEVVLGLRNWRKRLEKHGVWLVGAGLGRRGASVFLHLYSQYTYYDSNLLVPQSNY